MSEVTLVAYKCWPTLKPEKARLVPVAINAQGKPLQCPAIASMGDVPTEEQLPSTAVIFVSYVLDDAPQKTVIRALQAVPFGPEVQRLFPDTPFDAIAAGRVWVSYVPTPEQLLFIDNFSKAQEGTQ